MVFGWFRKPVGEIPCRFESCTHRLGEGLRKNHYSKGYRRFESSSRRQLGNEAVIIL